ncbi:MAG: hypothetical protein WCA08_19820 [Desulfoferrobacter sp.]
MTEKREICKCTKCGNEAEMIVTCELLDVEVSPGTTKQQQKETRKCTLCGNEADMIIDMTS